MTLTEQFIGDSVILSEDGAVLYRVTAHNLITAVDTIPLRDLCVIAKAMDHMMNVENLVNDFEQIVIDSIGRSP